MCMEKDTPIFTDATSTPSENASDEEMPILPTAFQLAQLAAIIAAQPESAKIPPAEVVLEALQLWDAACSVLAERQKEQAAVS